MTHYLISYDLRGQGRDYDLLSKLLQSWEAARLLEAVWVVSLNADAAKIRDALRRVLDPEDAVLVVELQRDAWWSGHKARPEGLQWLKKNIKS